MVQEFGREGVLPYSSFFASNMPFNAPLPGLACQWLISSIVMICAPPGDAYLFMLNREWSSLRHALSVILHYFSNARDSFVISFGRHKRRCCSRTCPIVHSRISFLELETTSTRTQMDCGVLHAFKPVSCHRAFGSSRSRNPALFPSALLGTWLLSSSCPLCLLTLRSLMSPLHIRYLCLVWLIGILGVSGFPVDMAIV